MASASKKVRSMNHATPLVLAALLLSAATGLARADEAPVDRPYVAPQGARERASDARTLEGGTQRDHRSDAPVAPRADADDKPVKARHWWPLRKYAPDEEPWDPSWQMDPRIGRYQRASAPN